MANEYNFDGINKVIQLQNTESVDVADMYSRWKEWVLSNPQYLQAFRFVGGDPTTTGNRLGITYFLINGWKIRAVGEDHVLDILGNLFTDDESTPYLPAPEGSTVTFRNTVSNSTEVIEVEVIGNAILTNILDKLGEMGLYNKEVWQVHGLDQDNPMTVSKTGRNVDEIDQDISTDDSGTTVTRNT